MNTTTETNSPLTPIQALQRCLAWFTLHHATAVLPGTKLPAVQELRNVIVVEDLRNDPDQYTLTLDKIKACVELPGLAGDALRGMIDLWYKIEIKNGESEAAALQTTFDKLGAKTLEIANGQKTDGRLADAVELLRRWVEIINAKPGENKAGILAAVESLLNTSSRFIIEHGENTENPTA